MYHSPRDLQRRRLRLLVLVLGAGVGFIVVSVLDHWILMHAKLPARQFSELVNGETVVVTRTSGEWLRFRDWYEMFRQGGHLPTWLLIAAAFFFFDWAVRREEFHATKAHLRHAWQRAGLLALAPTLSGIAAEVLLVVLRRERPGDAGLHEWVAWWEARPINGFGLPSSHAAVAFGGAFMLARLVPSVWPVAIAWAIGCGVSRVVAGAHFASDVYASAVVSLGIVSLLARSLKPRTLRSSLPGPIHFLT